jgi:hypothetical protein
MLDISCYSAVLRSFCAFCVVTAVVGCDALLNGRWFVVVVHVCSQSHMVWCTARARAARAPQHLPSALRPDGRIRYVSCCAVVLCRCVFCQAGAHLRLAHPLTITGHVVYGPNSSMYPLTHASGASRQELHALLSRYISLQPEVRAAFVQFATAQRMALPSHVAQALGAAPWVCTPDATTGRGCEWALSVHYRGSDTARHYPYRKVDYSEFFTEVDAVLEERVAEHGGVWRIIVATDETAFLDSISARYGMWLV